MGLDNHERADSQNLNLANSLPKTALQAIYHAVTGKTENLKKVIKGNVIIEKSDIDRLNHMIIDQTNIYDKSFAPVVTVVVKHDSEKSVTYSSWERFNALQVNNHEITSDLTIKYEFVIKLPNTDRDQRCVVTINLDSALPVIEEHRNNSDHSDEFGFYLSIFSQEWRTVNISIDFVDFLVAKSFLSVVEEWFPSLKKIKEKKYNNFFVKNNSVIRNSLSQLGRIGMAIFLISYIYFAGQSIISINSAILATSIGMIIWSIFSIIYSYVIKIIFNKATNNIIPSVIILNEADINCYRKINDSTTNPLKIISIYVITVVLSCVINVVSSYIYSYLSGK